MVVLQNRSKWSKIVCTHLPCCFVLLFCLFFPGVYSWKGTVKHPYLPCFVFVSSITQPKLHHWGPNPSAVTGCPQHTFTLVKKIKVAGSTLLMSFAQVSHSTFLLRLRKGKVNSSISRQLVQAWSPITRRDRVEGGGGCWVEVETAVTAEWINWKTLSL